MTLLVALALVAAGCGGGGGGKQAGSGAAPAGTGQTGKPSTGKQLFMSNGCGGCHTLAAAGTTGTTGPDFDRQLKSDAQADHKQLQAFVRESIVSPNAYIAKGYQPNIMPQSFGSTLSPQQLDTLVSYISSNVK
jgi:cytochrome c oxidase subunit 2